MSYSRKACSVLGIPLFNSPAKANLHATDSSFALVLLQVLKVRPPLKEHGLADELEPGGKGERGIVEHGLKLFGGYVFEVLDFVGVDGEVVDARGDIIRIL